MGRKYKQLAPSKWQPSGKRKAWNDYRSNKSLLILAVIAFVAVMVIATASYLYHFEGFASIWKSANSVSAENAENSGITGRKITVRAGGDLQAAINQATGGDTILLEANATFKGSFKLPKKKGNQFITIRTSAADSQLPAANKRLDPAKYGNVLPKIISPTSEPAIRTEFGAHHYRFIGIEFGPTKGGLYNIVEIGLGEETKIEDLASFIEFDRCYFRGSPTEGQRRGIAANGRNIKVINSYFTDMKRKGEESQGIAVWAGDSGFEFVNNYIEAGGENIIFGGAFGKLELIPSDIVVSDNHFNKPLEWRKQGWLVKNLFEIKSAKRAKIVRNLMTNNWTSGQNGTAVLFTVREDSGKNATIEDIEFSNNIVRGSGNAVNILGSEGAGGKRLTIRNNIFDDINGQKWDSGGIFLIATEWDGVIIENNTIINTGNITSAYGKPIKNFVFRNNIVAHNEYGFTGEGNIGQNTIAIHFPQSEISHNAIVGAKAENFRQKNAYPANWNLVGFIDFNKGNYQLRPDSRLRTGGFGGKTIGAELDSKTVGGN